MSSMENLSKSFSAGESGADFEMRADPYSTDRPCGYKPCRNTVQWRVVGSVDGVDSYSIIVCDRHKLRALKTGRPK